jgi:hypothetical protein
MARAMRANGFLRAHHCATAREFLARTRARRACGVTCSDVQRARVWEKKLGVKSTTCVAMCRSVDRGLWTCSRVHIESVANVMCIASHAMQTAFNKGLSTRRR